MEENKDLKKEYAKNLLEEKAKLLGRLPKKEDFPPQAVCFIKQKLGPWPRALEVAGLKECTKTVTSAQRNSQRRMNAKKRRRREKGIRSFAEKDGEKTEN